ncbi:MAG: type 4a pilus biogenesis protein PilO, partial [Acidobacteriota bacterium]
VIALWRRIFVERRSVLVPLAALLVIDVALLAGVVFPLKKVVASDTAAADASHFSTAVATQRLKQMQGARSSRDRAQQELAKFYGQVLPVSQAAAEKLALVEITKLVRENSLTLGAQAFEDEIIKDTPLRRLTTKVELLGDYAAVLHFIYDVETSEAFLAIRTVQLSQATRQQQNSGQLQLAMEIATYYRVPATAATVAGK